MDTTIKKILAELYELDPKLKEHESRLITIIERLIASKPDVKLDKHFVKQLRAELVGTSTHSFNFFPMKRFGFALGGIALAILLIIPVIKGGLFDSRSSVTEIGVNARPGITLLDDRAFGDISPSLAGIGSSNVVAESAAEGVIRPLAGGGGGGGFAETSMPVPGPDGPFVITQFNHVYTGEAIDLGQDSLEVLRRSLPPSRVGGLAEQFGLGLIDLDQLDTLQYHNLTLSEEDGDIDVSINALTGEISLNRRGEFYTAEEPYKPIQKDEIPSDEVLIGIANRFIDTYGINLTGYADPRVPEQFRERIAFAAAQPQVYLPEVISVVYPLSIEGTPVYDQGANPQGIYVNISVRQKEVISLHGLHVQRYEASLYPIQNDINKLVDRYNVAYVYPPEATVQTVDVKLGTPELVYTMLYQYIDGKEQNLIIPAYLFPVIEPPVGFPDYQDHILIPLIQQDQQRIFPL